MGDDLVLIAAPCKLLKISIHVPRVGDDRHHLFDIDTTYISIHVPRVGDDGSSVVLVHSPANFYPRPPRGGRHGNATYTAISLEFLSTSPAWGTTYVFHNATSIHVDISIHVPRVGDDGQRNGAVLPSRRFLSTSPAWGTTPASFPVTHGVDISIHVPRVGDDNSAFSPFGDLSEFLSTSPAWGTTRRRSLPTQPARISIHVPRVGDDTSMCYSFLPDIQFLSTSPAWGTTHLCCIYCRLWNHFYPRPPRGGRPATMGNVSSYCTISIHVPRVGDDAGVGQVLNKESHFYPRPPRGGRHSTRERTIAPEPHFYPRPPRGGRRHPLSRYCAYHYHFYPRPPRGGRRFKPGLGA